jgi:hypothetical protein
MASTPAPASAGRIIAESGRRRTRVRAAITATTTSVASGKYMRRSAPTSVAMGMTLEDGASVPKNHTPTKARVGRFHHPITVAASSASTTSA